MSWISDFAEPPAVFRPVPFWSWNEKMEPAEVRRQVQLMADAGWGGGFVHSRIGLITPYLGEEWFAATKAALEACREHGLKVWLYDEDKWPSGFSGGTVPLADESFRVKALIARKVGGSIPQNATPLGQAVDGLQVYRWVAPLGHDWFNGTCYADLMSRAAMRKFLVDAYQSYFDRFGQAYGRDKDIVAEFTDEPCAIFRGRLPAGAAPFTDELIERFRAMHGYEPVERLHLLFADAPGAEKFRLHYFRTINDLFENNFSKQLGDWCDEHGIDLTGHYMCEHGLYDQQLWGVKIMPNYRHEGIPGIDHLARQVEERISAKQCHSVVNQYGKKRMLSELYGVAGGGLSFEDRLWIASQQMCLGVNLLNHHLSLYTMAGCRKRDYPQNMFYPQPWWPLNRLIDDRLSRTCVALAQGKYVAEALVIHPQESTFVLWKSRTEGTASEGENFVWDRHPTAEGVRDRITELDKQVKGVIDTILGSQRTFDFADETILAEAGRVVDENGRSMLRIEQMSYPVVVLPGMETIAASTVDLLEQFQRAGGVVLRCGDAPRLLDGEPSPRLGQWLKMVPQVELSQLAAALRQHIAPAVELIDVADEDARLLYVHMREIADGERLVYLTNLNRNCAFAAKVRFAGEFKSAHLLDATNGIELPLRSEATAKGLVVELPFERTENHLVRLSPAAADGESISLMPPHVLETTELPAAAWRVERLDDNAITLDYASWREQGGEWSDRAMPVIAIQQRLNDLKFNGLLELRYAVKAGQLSPARKVHLVVEYPERYRISVNGREVKYQGLPAWRDFRWMPIDITGMLRDGENAIELRCDNFIPGDLASIHDQFARYGTEIEAVYLVGDFAVEARKTDERPECPWWEKFGLPPVEIRCFDQGSFVLSDPKPLALGDTTAQGLPFYPGRLKLSTALPSHLQGQRVMLQIEQLDAAVAEVAVDGEVVAHFMAHPLRVELTEAIGREAGELSITLYGTLRNLLGPHHHVMGELPSVGPHSFHPNWAAEEDRPQWIMRWMRSEVSPADWRDRYCMIGFGSVGKVSLQRVAQ